MSTVASLCFATFRRRLESLPPTGASETAVPVCGPSATARSIMVTPSTSILLTFSANSVLIGGSAGRKKRCGGSWPGSLTRSAIGASKNCVPYSVPLWLDGKLWWGGTPDPFDPRFAPAVDQMARNAAAQFGGDPWLVGYFVDNELAWGVGWSTDPREHYAVAIGTLGRGPESAAKSAFTAQLIETYREPERLAEAWGIPLTSWDGLRSADFVLPPASLGNPAVIRDLSIFTRRFAEAYFRAVAEALH